jgi:hypothetical protein
MMAEVPDEAWWYCGCKATLLIKIYKMGYADRACVPDNIHVKLNKKELAEYE